MSEGQVAEADLLHGGELIGHVGHGAKKGKGLVDGHGKHVGDIFSFVGDFEGFPIIAAALADIAGDKNIGQKMHFDLE